MNYSKSLLLSGIVILLIVILNYFNRVNLVWCLLPLCYLAAKVMIGSANIQSGFFTKTYCSGVTDKNEIALTFDDGPNKEFTENILNTLTEYDTKATFFLIGKNIKGNQDIVKKIDTGGHIIGNHTYTHSYFIDFKNTAHFTEELNTTSDLIFNVTGKRTRLFRPPYGVTTPAIAKACKKLGYDVVGWSIRSMDTTKDSAEKITERIIGQIQPGAVILLHDTSHKTTVVLKNILNYVKKNGIRIVPLNELLKVNAYL